MEKFKLKVFHKKTGTGLENTVNEFVAKDNINIIKIDYKVIGQYDTYMKYEVPQYYAFIHYVESKNDKKN